MIETPSSLDHGTHQFLNPATGYYLGKLLRRNLHRLKSVVMPGAAVRADSFNDLNEVLESLYIEPLEIDFAAKELEKLALVHQNLSAQGSMYETEIKAAEEKIYWLLGFKYLPLATSSKILLVDDNIRTLQLLTRLLKREGYEVHATAQSTNVISMANALMPDLILMDVNMPEVSGFETCKHLKTLQEHKNIPVIFLSSDGDSKRIQQGLDAGGIAYITKPFKLPIFLNGMKQLLGQSQVEAA